MHDDTQRQPDAPSTSEAVAGPILGIDYGERRIGVACSDELGMLAHPLEMVPMSASAEGAQAAARRVAELAAQKGARRVVIGLPRHMRSAEEGETAVAARAFGERLAAAGLAVAYWDERLTSRLAEQTLDATLGRGAKRRQATKAGRVDVIAACLLLQSYLDAQAHGRNAARTASGRSPEA